MILLLAESSNVLSNIEDDAFENATFGSVETYLAKEQALSEETGFLLNGIALEPTCFVPNGSESSPNGGDCKILTSKQNLWTLWAILASKESIARSIFRGYV